VAFRFIAIAMNEIHARHVNVLEKFRGVVLQRNNSGKTDDFAFALG
jgi:hypothetical protein